MASNTTTVVALMLTGFAVFFIGWPWWMGIGIIAMAAVLAMSSGSGEEPAMQMAPAMPIGVSRPAAARGAEPINDGFDAYDMKWSPSMFADGMPGNKMDGDFGSAVGSRSSAFTQDMGPIRFKDDFRFRLNKSAEAELYDMCTDPSTGKALAAWDFRTRKDYFPGLHTGNVKTVESPDELPNPGLGSPNDWIKAEKLRRLQQQHQQNQQ